MTQQECTLVEPLAPEPAGHFVIALAGVARTARRRDVVECVSPAPGERLHTVPLQRHVCRPAISTATPCGLERGPLLDAQVVLDAIHPTLAPTGVLGFPTTCDRHLPRLVGPAGRLRQRHLGLPDACLAANRTPKRLASMGFVPATDLDDAATQFAQARPLLFGRPALLHGRLLSSMSPGSHRLCDRPA